MKLRTQFIITMLLFGSILVVTALSEIITSQHAEKAGKQEKIAGHIAKGASELSYLSNDYQIYRESQQLKRWQSRFVSFSAEVAGLRADRPEQQALIANIQANRNRLKEVFDSVAGGSEIATRSQGAALDPTFFQVSWSRMAVQSQGLIADASRLSQLLHQQRDQLTTRRTMLMYVMVGLMGLFLLVSYLLAYRRILKSILSLRAGTAIIGSGNLDFEIHEKKNDEIGDLSRAFNRMTADLKTVTASKADLEREIAERKRAEEELRRQREWLRVTLSSIGDAVIASDTSGRITFLNPIAQVLTGWQAAEAEGQPVQSVFRIINGKSREPGEDIVRRVLQAGFIVTLANHTALIARDGREIPIEDSAAPIRDSDGQVLGVVLVFHDVTEKRRAQEALRESERLERERAAELAVLLDAVPAPVFIAHDPDCLHLTGNRAADELLQIPLGAEASLSAPSETKPRHFRAFKDGRELRLDELPAQRAARGDYVRDFEFSLIFDDGTIRHVLGYGTPLLNEQGRPRGAVHVLVDITARKRAEEELREAHKRAVWLAQFPEQNPNPVIRASADGTVLYCNPVSSRLRGWTCEAGRSLQNNLLTLVGRALAEGREVEQDVKLGERLYLVGVIPFPEERYATIYSHDITERKMAEESLRKAHDELEQRVQERTAELRKTNEELQQRNRDLEDFAHVASHDLQEPLRKIQTFADLLATSRAEAVDDKARDYLERMRRTAGRMQDLVIDLLRYSRVVSRQETFTRFNLREPIEEAVTDLETLCEETGGRIEVGDLPDIAAGRVQMRQLFQNLIANGLKYRGAEKPVVRVYRRPTSGSFREICVEDNGIGFEECYLEKIFKPFQRLHGKESVYEGTGMGLAICRRIVERHGGSITAASAPGKGATFIVKLPGKQ